MPLKCEYLLPLAGAIIPLSPPKTLLLGVIYFLNEIGNGIEETKSGFCIVPMVVNTKGVSVPIEELRPYAAAPAKCEIFSSGQNNIASHLR